MEKRLFNTKIPWFTLVLRFKGDKAYALLLKKKWINTEIIHHRVFVIEQLADFISDLTGIDPAIDQNNIEINIVLDYPLSVLQKVSVPSHVRKEELTEVIGRKIKSNLLGMASAVDLNISYTKMKEEINSVTYQVSIIKKDILNTIQAQLKEYQQNVVSIVPAVLFKDSIKDRESVKTKYNDLPEDFIELLTINRDIIKRGSINHAAKEIKESVEIRKGVNLYSKATIIWGGLILILLLVGFGINRFYHRKNQNIIARLSNDRKHFVQYKELLKEEEAIISELKKYHQLNQLKSAGAWMIYQLEKNIPASIYLDKLGIEKSDSTRSRIELKGIVEREMDLYEMMEKLKSESFVREISLRKLVKKNSNFSQFELEVETD